MKAGSLPQCCLVTTAKSLHLQDSPPSTTSPRQYTEFQGRGSSPRESAASKRALHHYKDDKDNYKREKRQETTGRGDYNDTVTGVITTITTTSPRMCDCHRCYLEGDERQTRLQERRQLKEKGTRWPQWLRWRLRLLLPCRINLKKETETRYHGGQNYYTPAENYWGIIFRVFS